MPRPKPKPRLRRTDSRQPPAAAARPAAARPPTRNAIPRLPQSGRHSLILILATAWIANYLHFLQFGIYEDDWFYTGMTFLSPVGALLRQSWEYLLAPGTAQGRPLQFIANILLPLPGKLTGSFAAIYPVGFGLLAGSAAMMYLLLRRRFSNLTATLAALLFVVTPLHTLHQFLNGQFSVGPAFLLVFGAMLLYLNGRRAWAYVLAPLSLLCYESVFFLFIGAPLLRRGRLWQGRRREWAVHGLWCGLMVAAYFVSRKFVFHESRTEALPGALHMIGPVLHDWIFYAAGSFTTYYWAAWRAVRLAPAEAWLWLIPVLAFAAWLAYGCRRRLASRGGRALWMAAMARPAGAGLVFLALGYAISYFYGFTMNGRYPYTDRPTRISMAGSFGSSLLAAGLLAGWIRAARRTEWAAWGVTAALFALCFVFSFAIQEDYVRDWVAQRREVEQIIRATPDVERDSQIVLRWPFAEPGTPGRPGMGEDRAALDQFVQWSFEEDGGSLPRLFIVMTDDWKRFLRRTPDGSFAWTQELFDGRWYAAKGQYRPGRFIIAERLADGRVVRRTEPVLIDGTDIVQYPPARMPDVPLWRRLRPNVLGRKLIPSLGGDGRHRQVSQ